MYVLFIVCEDSYEKRSIHNVSSCRVSVKTAARLSSEISQLNITWKPSRSAALHSPPPHFIPILCVSRSHVPCSVFIISKLRVWVCVTVGGVLNNHLRSSLPQSALYQDTDPASRTCSLQKIWCLTILLGSVKMVRVSPECGCAAEMLWEIMREPTHGVTISTFSRYEVIYFPLSDSILLSGWFLRRCTVKVVSLAQV